MGAQEISVDRLQPGVFVELDLAWHRHPFLFNKFKIKDEDDIAVLKDIGLSSVRFDPKRSDVQPLPEQSEPVPQVARATISKASPMAEEKRRRIERLKVRRERYQRCDRVFKRQVSSARSVMSELKARPAQAVKQANVLVSEMVEVLSAEGELMVQLMNDNTANETLYFHALNVSVLAMMLAKNLDLDAQTMHIIGLGALLHDIGKERIPPTVLHKRGPWTRAERDFVQQHPRYGVEMAQKTPDLPPLVLTIIEQHHERADGSGYPSGLTADRIALETKVVQIADAYDNHCNPRDPKQAKTPHQAVSHLMAFQSALFDPTMIQVFIKGLGVYPPGSVVRLSNDMVGIIIGADQRDLLRPSVLLYDPAVPKSEALIVDMVNEPELSITEEISPADLSAEVVSYLSPRTRVSYYFDSGAKPKGRRTG